MLLTLCMVGRQVHWVSTRIYWSWWGWSANETAESLSECRCPLWWNWQGTSGCAHHYVTIIWWGRFYLHVFFCAGKKFFSTSV